LCNIKYHIIQHLGFTIGTIWTQNKITISHANIFFQGLELSTHVEGLPSLTCEPGCDAAHMSLGQSLYFGGLGESLYTRSRTMDTSASFWLAVSSPSSAVANTAKRPSGRSLNPSPAKPSDALDLFLGIFLYFCPNLISVIIGAVDSQPFWARSRAVPSTLEALCEILMPKFK
jgi:hypothetical protein